ncbi:MAG TPA: SafA/ExsA family spore coat assembly protein [Firmicutes bacterium]|nr:SafA/ExsA family spore coat assembly protein [Bacillota bacterium]
MSITVQSRFLRVRDYVGEGKASVILQDTLDLPGEYPDVERVIAAHAVGRNVEAVCGEGRVVMRGTVDVRLLYEAAVPAKERRERHYDHDDDESGHDHESEHAREHEHEPEERPATRLILAEFREVCPFELAVEVSGALPEHKAKARVTSESVAATLVNRRRLGCDVALVGVVEVSEDQEVRAVVDATALPPDKVQWVREMMHVEHLAAEGLSPLRLEVSLALPPEEPALAEVAWVVPRSHHVTGRTGEGKAFVEGLVDVEVVYLTGNPEHPVHSFRWLDAHRFALTFDLPGVRSGMMLLVDLEVGEVTGVRENEQCVTVVIGGEVRVAARHLLDLPLLTDAVAESGVQLDVIRKTVRFPHHLPEGYRQATVGGVVSLPPTKPPVDRVIWTKAAFIADQVIVEEGRVTVEGDLSLALLYLADTPGLLVQYVEFPRGLRVSEMVEAPGLVPGMWAHPHVHVHAVSVRLVDPETLQIDVTLHLHVRALSIVQAEVVVECVVVSPCPPGTSLRMVIVQPGDTLWKLSRRYGVPLEAIIRANPQIPNPDLIYPGQKVRIPCVPLAARQDPA